jgi:hypothetical protein
MKTLYMDGYLYFIVRPYWSSRTLMDLLTLYTDRGLSENWYLPCRTYDPLTVPAIIC